MLKNIRIIIKKVELLLYLFYYKNQKISTVSGILFANMGYRLPGINLRLWNWKVFACPLF